MTDDAGTLKSEALVSKAWPFEEARKLLDRVEKGKTSPDEILFETGYGQLRLESLLERDGENLPRVILRTMGRAG